MLILGRPGPAQPGRFFARVTLIEKLSVVYKFCHLEIAHFRHVHIYKALCFEYHRVMWGGRGGGGNGSNTGGG